MIVVCEEYEVYQANELNQYVQRTVPGVAHVDGSAAPEAKVTMSVDGGDYEAAIRQRALHSLGDGGGAFFHLPAVRRKCVGTTWQAGKKVALVNPAVGGQILAPVTIVAAIMNGGSNLEGNVRSVRQIQETWFLERLTLCVRESDEVISEDSGGSNKDGLQGECKNGLPRKSV